jgi:hypothetical protein
MEEKKLHINWGNVKQLLSLYPRFYEVTMLESINAIGEGKRQVYF